MRPVLCSFFFFILSFSSFDAAAMHTGEEDPHRWQAPTGHMIREYRNNWYLWSADDSYREAPEGHDGSALRALDGIIVKSRSKVRERVSLGGIEAR